MGDEPGPEGQPTEGTTVWMVSYKTGLAGREGTLALEEGSLVFRPRSRSFGDTRIELGHIRRVKRVRGSPVIDVRVVAPTHPERIGFYFVQPPSLEPARGLHISPIRAARRQAAQSLVRSSAPKRAELDGWVERIRAAKARE